MSGLESLTPSGQTPGGICKPAPLSSMTAPPAVAFMMADLERLYPTQGTAAEHLWHTDCPPPPHILSCSSWQLEQQRWSTCNTRASEGSTGGPQSSSVAHWPKSRVPGNWQHVACCKSRKVACQRLVTSLYVESTCACAQVELHAHIAPFQGQNWALHWRRTYGAGLRRTTPR
jgi:hypothetical protein